jgi:hypothetical protein
MEKSEAISCYEVLEVFRAEGFVSSLDELHVGQGVKIAVFDIKK